MSSRDEIESLYTRTVMAPEYQRALTEPDATLGWAGDPDLTLAWNRLDQRYEIWREEAWQDYTTGKWQTIHRIIARAPRGDRLDVTEMIRGLVARDTAVSGQSHEKAMEKYIRDVEAESAAKDEAAFQAIAPIHEKLAWTMAKATDNHKPFVSLTKTVR
jgi:hypothetical protein